jgi:aminopeptidase N
MPQIVGDKLVNPFDSPQIKEVLSIAMTDSFWAIRSFALDQFSMYHMSFTEEQLNKLKSIALTDDKPSVRSKAIYLLSTYNNKAYLDIYKNAIDAKPYSVAGAGLSGYLKSGDQTLKIDLATYEKVNSLHIMIPLADYFINSGTKGKYEWFKNKLQKGSPRVIYNMLNYFTTYLLEVDRENINEGKKVLKEIADNNRFEVIRNTAKDNLNEIDEKMKQ